jgi:hypothetical protein
VDKSTGKEDKDCGGDKEREETIVACKYDCGKTFDIKKKTGSAIKARHEKGCSANKAGSANETGSANKAGMNKDGKRPADDDSGDAHLPGEGHKKKQSLSLNCSPFVLWLHAVHLCMLECCMREWLSSSTHK